MYRPGLKASAVRTATALMIVALAAVLAGAVGCARVTPVELPDGPAGITGTIKSIDRSERQDVWGSILVQGGLQPEGAVSDKAMVAITQQTLLAQSDRWIPPDALEVGMKVRVWFDGPVAESYPVQGSAGFILVEAAPAP